MELVFKALADESRRELLDALRSHDGQTLGELCERLPQMTRFGVSSHLGVLEAAGLITTRREGRRKLHYLNAVPLREIQRRWLSEFTARTSDSLLDLKAHLETKERPMPENRHVFTIYIDAPRQAVWDELTSTGTVREWLYDSVTTSTWREGEPYSQAAADGTVLIDGVVLEAREPEYLALSFDCHWDADVEPEEPGRLEYELSEVSGQTKLVVITSQNGPETTAQAAEGTPWIYSRLKSILESRTVRS